jgi:tetratricopeptide (TPR) repeat protein
LGQRDARYVGAAEAGIDRRYEEAAQAYREIIDRYPYDTEARYFLAHSLWDLGRLEEGIEELEVLADLEPNNSAVWSMLGHAHLELGDFNQAVVALQRYLELEPTNPNAHHSLADAYRAQGELDLAASAYERALELDPTFYYAATSLAVVDVLRGKRDEARRRLELVVEEPQAPPRNRIDAGFELAYVLRSEGRFRRAAEVLASLGQLIEAERVREAMSLAVQGSCWAEVGDSRRARELIEQAIAKSPGVPTRYLFARGSLELRRGEMEAVRSTANQILAGALPPDDPDRTEDKAAAYLRGAALLTEGEVSRAADELMRAVALNGYEYAVYRRELAQVYLARGRPQEAMAAARQAASERNPFEPRLDLELDRARAQLVLGEALLQLGETSKAAELAANFLEAWADADPGRPEIEQARRLVNRPSS